MWRDFLEALSRWRLIHVLGMMSIRSRYARSTLGQVWMTLSVFFLVVSTGLVWSFIWHAPVKFFLPYVCAGYVFYLFVSSTVNESTTCIIADHRLYINQKMPCSISVMTHVYRSFVILLHNLPILIALLLWSSAVHIHFGLFYIPALFLILFFLFFSSYTLAVICTRFRDLIPLVASLMQVAFLVTPVMWQLKVIPQHYHFYVLLNPFASCLEVLRNPLIGIPVEKVSYFILLSWTAFAAGLAFLVHRYMEKNTVFWI